MSIPSQIYKLVRPTSKTDSNYEEFEFLLAWYGRTGQYINLMFTDWVNEQENDSFILNRLNLDKLQSVHVSESRRKTLVIENVSKSDLIVYSSILSAKKIVRVFKDGTTENVGINSNGFNYRQTDGRYNLQLSIELYEKALAR